MHKKVESWVAEWAYPAHEDELLTLFLAAFGHKMPIEFWRWKYKELNILGSLVRKGGQVVAFYGGMPRDIHLLGATVKAVQIGDVMVHPNQRGILTRTGPFFIAATYFAEHFVGHQKSFVLAFGFPSERAFRLGERLGLYDKTGTLVQVNWSALQARPSLRLRIRPLSVNDEAFVNQIWQIMANALRDQVVGVRDWTYIQNRYLSHPTHDYQLFKVASRLTGAPVGMMVLRVLDDTIELVDVIAQPQHIKIVVHCLRRLAWRLGKTQIYTWITAQNADYFIADTGQITPTGIVIPHIKWLQGITTDKLVDRWWLMSGDTDFH